ncbi:hypothetical protein HCAG_07685 [Histoplasma mississippiense (nom. inval.)]|uniref:hypothetical protein n=1 Tax=Ajellomyces capsulatus (strain NAm1 / WU24) TaxID=2059318 RepID=UPI000157D059|nr:hypothetical protein HCAG_07685 [Histoplasma mississippiense (nom. inval.)]EDN11232.1 hypothetical protein HCAG_07685 [Histoplasma mississippiense (nom. inval.)]
MGSPLASDENFFELLQQQSADPKLLEEQQQAVNERINAIYQKAQARLAELIDQNSTLPCTISSVQVLNANNTRRGFLERVLSPLLSSNNHRPYTLSEALKEISVCTDTLSRFDIFEHPISVFLDKPSQVDPSTSPTDLEVYLSVKEKSRILLKTGTDLGNAEGSAYTNFMWRNIFGGAESLNINASLGTRTKSAYQATFETPILSNPDVRCEFGGIGSSTEKSWASHEEAVKGGWAKLRWLSAHGHRHELGYNGFWRQVTGLSTSASPTVRGDAGDSVKSSICHTWINDQRDNPFLPSQGFYMRTFNEMAGWGPLKGDVSFWKSEVEAQGAIPIPIPGVKGNTGFSLTTGARAGVLCPLGLDAARKPQLSRINDRFQLGGPTDVRGFRLSGIGPREGPDALGGDVFAACSANLLCPLPRVGAEKPLRLQAFVNCGRLLSLKTQNGKLPSTQGEVMDSIFATVSELKNELPSMAAGLGLVYAHPAARLALQTSNPYLEYYLSTTATLFISALISQTHSFTVYKRYLIPAVMAQFYSQHQQQQQPYGAGPQQQSAHNLQFYPTSYSSVSGHTTPSQATYGGYGVASGSGPGFSVGGGGSGVAGGYGAAAFGASSSGVSGRMGEQGGLRTGWLAAFGTEGYEGEPPLLEELGVNFDHIRKKTLTVLNPFARVDQHLMDDSDLYGALLYIILYGTFLLLSGKVFYGYIYGVAVFGTFALHLILSLMSPSLLDPISTGPETSSLVDSVSATAGYHPHDKPSGSSGSSVAPGRAGHLSSTLTFPRSASVLGYCFLPLVLTSGIGILLPMDTLFGYLLTTAAVGWCTYSSSGMFCAVARMRGMRFLVAYPLALFYVVFGIMGIFSSRGGGSLVAKATGG